MSVVVSVRAVSTQDVQHLHAHPEDCLAYLLGEDFVPVSEVPRRRGWRFWRRTPSMAREAEPPRTFPSPDPADEVDLDKAWHGLHFLLTGSARETDGEDTRGALMAAGSSIGGPEWDVGYGPARSLSPAQTIGLRDALRDLDPEQARRRFDPEAMKAEDVYPPIDWADPEFGGFEWLCDTRDRLLDVVQRAVDTNRCLVIWAS